MMKYDPYTLTELIRNDDFIAWVRHPDAANEAYWSRFLLDFPEKSKVVEDARGYVNLLAEDTGKNKPTVEQSTKMWHVIEKQLHEEKALEIVEPVRVISLWRWTRIAASIALILGIASISFWYLSEGQGIERDVVVNNSDTKGASDIIEKTNSTDKPMTILLEDGSSVVLTAGRIS